MAGTKKILLVEDDNNLREIYGARLQAEGYDIVSAPDGENALAIAVKEKPDLIISDIMMPKVSGFDMLDILRNAPETRDTKVIMMTALSQAEDKARADKLGADMYLVKSQVTLEDVTKAVHKILDEPSDSAQEADSAAAQEMVSGGVKAEEATPEHPKEQPPAAQPAPQPEPTPEPQPEPPKPEPPAPEPTPPAPVSVTEPPVASNVPAEPAKQPEAQAAAAPVPSPAPEAQTAAPSTSIPVTNASDDDTSDSAPVVEPNLAQALEDEEKAVQEKIDNFETSDDADSNQPAPAAQEAAPPTPADETVSAAPSSEPQAETAEPKIENPLDDKPSKKVIEPINDLSKTPDITALVAKEEAKEAAANGEGSPATSQVIKPAITVDDEAAQNTQNSSDVKDDIGKISL